MRLGNDADAVTVQDRQLQVAVGGDRSEVTVEVQRWTGRRCETTSYLLDAAAAAELAEFTARLAETRGHSFMRASAPA